MVLGDCHRLGAIAKVKVAWDDSALFCEFISLICISVVWSLTLTMDPTSHIQNSSEGEYAGVVGYPYSRPTWRCN